MILLEELLAGLDVEASAFALCRIRRGGDLQLQRFDEPTIHYVLEGSGVLWPEDAEPFAFCSHSVIILPPKLRARISDRHCASTLASMPGRCVPLPDGWSERVAGTGATAALMACGAVRATYRQSAGLFDNLAVPLIENFGENRQLCLSFEALLGELAEPKPGNRAMADALMQQCLVLILRRHCESGECRLPWLSALEDPRLRQVLSAMLVRPESDFTLESLAELAGMSRSAFAARFAEVFERTPIDFLKQLRLTRAARLLRTTALPVKSVASRVGYDSRSYFSRAFKARYGSDPLTYRRAGPRHEHAALPAAS